MVGQGERDVGGGGGGEAQEEKVGWEEHGAVGVRQKVHREKKALLSLQLPPWKVAPYICKK